MRVYIGTAEPIQITHWSSPAEFLLAKYRATFPSMEHVMNFRRTQSFDRLLGEMTFARACHASRNYVVIKVPYSGGDPRTSEIVLDLSGLDEDQKRFVLEDITPDEYRVSIGEQEAVELDRSR
jgi:hypothetical protein